MLLPLLSIMAMAAAAQPADTTAQPRDAYATCLRKFMTSQLDKKTKPDEFDKALQPACEQQETAFRNAILAADKAEGMSDTDAQEDAQFQVDDYLDTFKNNYRDYLETHTDRKSVVKGKSVIVRLDLGGDRV